MNRRDFIKLGGIASLALFSGAGGFELLSALPVEMAVQGKIFRGTHDGKIYVSEDGSQTWQLHTNLGNDCSIRRFSVGANNQVHVQVSYQKYTFQLALSKNGKFWNSNTLTYPA